MMLPTRLPHFGEFRQSTEPFLGGDSPSTPLAQSVTTTLTLLSNEGYKTPEKTMDTLVMTIKPKDATLELLKEGKHQRGYLFSMNPQKTYDWFKTILAPCVNEFPAPDDEKTTLLSVVTDHLNRLKG